MKRIFCDICKKEAPLAGHRHLEVKVESKTSRMFWFSMHDEHHQEIDICYDCWKVIFKSVEKEVSSHDHH